MMAAALAAPNATQAASQGGQGPVVAYVGAYTNRGKGIHIFTMNPADGALTPRGVVTGLANPSTLYIHPNGKFLYTASEVQGRGGTVTALAINPSNGDLTVLNTAPSGGRGPAHVSVDPAGKFVFAANYGSGEVGVVSIQPDGSLGRLADSKKITGPLGKQPAKDAPPGSFAISGHDAPHAHMAQTDPSGKYLLVADLGTDRVYIYRVNPDTGALTPNRQPFVQASDGAGPRHFAFHPNGKYLYSLNEEASTLDVMSWNGAGGEATIKQTLPTLPKGFEGTNYPSEIMVSADGRFVYCANRLYDTIAIFAVNKADGLVKPVDWAWTHGSYPRNFNFDPTGRFFYVLHSQSDNMTCFRVDRRSGRLTFTGRFYGVGNPSEIRFLRVGG
jgi:6-phosphogluconolactonase (cycloisomerase 2 family)